MFSCFKFVYLTVALFIHAAARLFLDFQAGGKAAQAGTSLNKQKQERTVEIKNQKYQRKRGKQKQLKTTSNDNRQTKKAGRAPFCVCVFFSGDIGL